MASTKATDLHDDQLTWAPEPEENEVNIEFDIASYPSDLTLSVINEMWKNGDIVIPEFQRNFVWSIRQSSLLIESFLVGLPVPQVFFYIDESSRCQVIDGQQRIMSIVYFMEGYFGPETLRGSKKVFRLEGLADTNPLAKKRFVDLSENSQRQLRNAVLRAINIRQLSPKGEATSAYHIFERLNTGGTPLMPQEIRNCVFRGELVTILRDLNRDANWRKLLGKVDSDRHQKDVELILRIFALTHYRKEYHKPMKEFLNRVMSRERAGDSSAVQSFARRFPALTSELVSLLHERPFHGKGPLSSAVLDAVFVSLIDTSKPLPHDLADRFAKLRGDKDFQDSTNRHTSDDSAISGRIGAAMRHLPA